MWMDHQSLSRKKLETAFADAQNKLNNIHVILHLMDGTDPPDQSSRSRGTYSARYR
jgi:hypothetical protein